jgi:hypothetical protein
MSSILQASRRAGRDTRPVTIERRYYERAIGVLEGAYVDALLIVCYAMANPDAEESPVQPVIVMPLHDPQGQVLPQLYRVTPLLGQAFAAGYASLTSETQLHQGEWVDRLVATGFYRLSVQPADAPLGERFRALYREAATQCNREQPLHLCFADRVAFALQDAYREVFLDDVRASEDGPLPLLFQRSAHAWQTHPYNYREVEHMATQAGALLTGRSLDWTWCHLVIRAAQLDAALPSLAQQEISVLGELLLALLRARHEISTRDVDWLAWEDPFILGQPADELRQVREGSVSETRKRLAYVIPTLELLARYAGEMA